MPDASTLVRAPRAEATKASRRFTVCGGTDVGRERDENQDTFVIADLASGRMSRPCVRTEVSVCRPGMLAVVCDGMGGPPAGDVAAEVAAATIKDELARAGSALVDTPGPTLKSALEGANRAILAEANAHPEDTGMGTTCTAAVFGLDHLSLAQVGDSRAYLLRGGRLELLTRDQTMASQLVEADVLAQALGTTGRVQPVITDVPLQEGDRILLCSDGLHGPVSDDAIASILKAPDDPAAAAQALIAAALASGGPDNVTVIVADCGPLEAPR